MSVIEDNFMLKKAQILATKKNTFFLKLDLFNAKLGDISALEFNIPQESNALDSLLPNSPIEVKGKLQEHNGATNIIISKYTLLEEGTYDRAYITKMPPASIEDLTNTLNAICGMVKDKTYKTIIDYTLEQYLPSYTKGAAATSFHHNYEGGLLEHTVGVLSLALQMCELYKFVDKELVITGALLHDIGKIKEISENSYTYEGTLLGHIAIGRDLIKSVPNRDKLDQKKLMLLDHVILSHHKNLEWGSPVEPKIPEAIIVHFADTVDAQMKTIHEAYTDDLSEEECLYVQRKSFSGRLIRHEGISRTKHYIDLSVLPGYKK